MIGTSTTHNNAQYIAIDTLPTIIGITVSSFCLSSGGINFKALTYLQFESIIAVVGLGLSTESSKTLQARSHTVFQSQNVYLQPIRISVSRNYHIDGIQESQNIEGPVSKNVDVMQKV